MKKREFINCSIPGATVLRPCKMISFKVRFLCRFVPACCIIITILIISCNQKKQTSAQKKDAAGAEIKTVNNRSLESIAKAKKVLTDGMLITRSDDDFESLTLQNFSQRERSFSHSGIVFKEDTGFVVYHSMAGTENPNGACRRDPFDSFVNPVQKTGFGVFKYDLSATEIGRFHHQMKQHFASKMPFDISFDLKTDDSLYCSEMIYKDLRKITGGRIQLHVSVINDFHPKIMGYKYNSKFYKRFEFIGIDDLYLNPFCREIMRIKY